MTVECNGSSVGELKQTVAVDVLTDTVGNVAKDASAAKKPLVL